jgi:hypothetical protein
MHLTSVLLNPAFVSMVFLFLSVLWMLKDPSDKTRPLLVFALVLNLFYGFLLTTFMGREGSLFPWKYDHILFAMDQSLGLEAARIAGPLQGFWRVPLWVVYQSMIPAMILWFLVTSNRNRNGSVVLAYAAELVAGPAVYTILPACGPFYAFGLKWLNPPAVSADLVRLGAIPNAFPSLHVATALVLLLFAPSRWWRALSVAFLAATCLATLSTGEHYVIDLVAGLAFGLFAANVGFKRFRRAFGFLGVACAWSLAVRFGHVFLIGHPIATRSLAALTVLLAVAEIVKEWSAHHAPATDSVAAPQAILNQGS